MDTSITPYYLQRTRPNNCSFSKKISSFGKNLGTFFREVIAVFTEVIPSRLRWIFRVSSGSQIQEQKISGLFSHNLGKQEKPALLFVHGDHAHPSTLLPLIDSLKKHTSFSLFLFYNEKEPKQQRNQIKKVIDFIANTQKCGPLILVGHSKGAIESSYLAFVKENPNIRAVVSIAGRLAIPEGDKSCNPILAPTIKKIEQAIKNHPTIPLYQIIAEKDWNAPKEATCVRPQSASIIKNALHLNVLYYPETRTELQKFLNLI